MLFASSSTILFSIARGDLEVEVFNFSAPALFEVDNVVVVFEWLLFIFKGVRFKVLVVGGGDLSSSIFTSLTSSSPKLLFLIVLDILTGVLLAFFLSVKLS